MITAGCLAQANWLLGSKSKIVPSLKWLSAEICVVLSMVATIKTPTQQETKGTLGFMKKICPLLRAQSAMHESISQMAFQTPWTRHKWCRRETKQARPKAHKLSTQSQRSIKTRWRQRLWTVSELAAVKLWADWWWQRAVLRTKTHLPQSKQPTQWVTRSRRSKQAKWSLHRSHRASWRRLKPVAEAHPRH